MSLIKEKIDQAKAIVKKEGIDCWITFARETQINGDPTLAFLATADLTWHSAFIVTASGEAHAIVGQYDQKTVEETHAYDSVEGFVEGIRKPFLNRMRTIDPKQIAVNYSVGSEICDGLTHGMYVTLQGLLAEIGMENRLISAERIVSSLREQKTPLELNRLCEAIRITEEIFAEVHGFIQPGRSEKEIAEFMQSAVRDRDLELAWDASMCPAVFTGPEGAGAHYAPSEKVVESGHVLNMDFGVRVKGYCSDMQRTFYVPEEGETAAPPEVQRGFDTIVEAIESSRQAMKPGIEGHRIDAVAREIVKQEGFQEFPHGLGHQVGRFSHDGTALLGPAWEKYAQKPFQLLVPNMVFTLEPRLTIPHRGVVTIEEMVVVTETGAEYLSKPQKELWLISP